MRLHNVFHHALGDQFTRMRPELAAFPLPVLRVALRSQRPHLDPPHTPVIAHDHNGTAMVWTLEPAVPTLVRPARLLGDPVTHADLATDTGPHRVAVLTPQQALAACWRVCPPTPPPSMPAPALARRLRDLHLELGQLAHQPMPPAVAVDMLAALTVCAQLYPALLSGLAEQTAAYDDAALTAADNSPALTAADVPDLADLYGGGTAGATAAARQLLTQAAGRLSDLAGLLADAHQQLDRLRTPPKPPTTTPAR